MGSIGLAVGFIGFASTTALWINGESSGAEVVLSLLSAIPIVSFGRFYKASRLAGEFSMKNMQFTKIDSLIGGQIGLYSQTMIRN